MRCPPLISNTIAWRHAMPAAYQQHHRMEAWDARRFQQHHRCEPCDARRLSATPSLRAMRCPPLISNPIAASHEMPALVEYNWGYLRATICGYNIAHIYTLLLTRNFLMTKTNRTRSKCEEVNFGFPCEVGWFSHCHVVYIFWDYKTNRTVVNLTC